MGSSANEETWQRLPEPPLCLVTDEALEVSALEEAVAAAIDGGCRWVQLRHRRLADRALLVLAQRLRRITRRSGAVFVVNDRADIALAVDADGLHLPASGLDPQSARRLIGSSRLLGRSVHAVSEIRELASAPLDYFQFGPVFETPSKRPFGPPQGLGRLREAVEAARPRPVVAIGGINSATVRPVLEAGARAVAAIRALTGTPPQAKAATETFLASISSQRASTSRPD